MASANLPEAWVVDDDPTVRDILEIALGGDFAVQPASSGEEVLERLLAGQAAGRAEPGVVLLDIEMEMLDGYQTCQRLRRAGLTMPVLFVSGHDTLEERLLAFDAGGDDFISKPFDSELVLVKAQRAMKRYVETARIKEEKSQLQDATLRFLHEVGERGVLLDFLRDTLRDTDYATLAGKLMRTASDYGVQCHVQIRHAEGAHTQTPGGVASALELSIMEHATTLGREFRLGKRLILNSDHVTLLVLNMPREEEEALRLAGYLEVLVESTQAIAETIEIRRESASLAETLMVASNESFCTLEDLRDGYRKQQVDTRLLLQEMIDGLEKSYVHLGLTDSQEMSISSTIRHSSEKILDLFEMGVNFDRQFSAVLDSMKPKKSNSPEVWV
jgi:DNA-binding response OmpR family regulator